jgi:hypothetical protein
VRAELHKAKDALDLYAYIHLKTPAAVAAALEDPRDAATLDRLKELFGPEQGSGVRRVLTLVPGLSADEQGLIAKHIVRSVAAVR